MFGRTYERDLPDEAQLASDLESMIRLYRLLTYRGGVELDGTDEILPPGEGVEDRRRFGLHRRIERNRKLAEEAKRVHGLACQACDRSLEDSYGKIGVGYIEAHHLTPLAELPEDRAVPLDPMRDFAVLCPNCHRMIHRPGAPHSLEEFRVILSRQAK